MGLKELLEFFMLLFDLGCVVICYYRYKVVLMRGKHVDIVAVVVVAVIVVVGLQTIRGGLWRRHWGDGYCCVAEKGL